MQEYLSFKNKQNRLYRDKSKQRKGKMPTPLHLQRRMRNGCKLGCFVGNCHSSYHASCFLQPRSRYQARLEDSSFFRHQRAPPLHNSPLSGFHQNEFLQKWDSGAGKKVFWKKLGGYSSSGTTGLLTTCPCHGRRKYEIMHIAID